MDGLNAVHEAQCDPQPPLKHRASKTSQADVLLNPKYVGNIYGVTVAVDFLGIILWVCPLSPGTTPDVLIWDREEPHRQLGDFFGFEVGLHDGAYKGGIHTVDPFNGSWKLADRQEEYNDVHGWYHASVEHIFAQLQ